MRPSGRLFAMLAILLASMLGRQMGSNGILSAFATKWSSYVAKHKSVQPEAVKSVAPKPERRAVKAGNPKKLDQSLCTGDLSGQYYDGYGNQSAVKLRFKIRMIRGNTIVRNGLRIVKGEAATRAEWTDVLPDGKKDLIGTGPVNSVLTMKGKSKSVARGRVDQISVNLSHPNEPKHRFDGMLSLSTDYSYDKTSGKPVEAKGRAIFDLIGLDGSRANLQGATVCEEKRS